jgi:hypothetical protein
MHSDDPQLSAEIYAWILQRRVARHYLYVDEHRPISVDTSSLTSYLWETAVRWQDGTVEIVAQYGQQKTAKEGHLVVIRAIIDKFRDTDKSVLAVLPDIGDVIIDPQVAEEFTDRIATLIDDAHHQRGKEGNDKT